MGGFISRIKYGWQSLSMEDKVEFVLDLICNIGIGSVCAGIGSKYAADKRVATRICASIGMGGLGVAAGGVASKTLMDNIGTPLCNVVKKAREEKKDE